MKKIFEIFKSFWSPIMDSNVNPLKNITNLKIRHMIMQILAFMWSGVFSLYIVDSLYVFGITAIAHLVFITAIFVTALVFKTAKNKPEVFDHKFFRGKDGEHE